MAGVEMMTAARSAREVLASSRNTVDPALRAAVDTLPASMRRIVAYHFGWWDEHGRPVRGDGGKAIRAALVLLTAEAVGGGGSMTTTATADYPPAWTPAIYASTNAPTGSSSTRPAADATSTATKLRIWHPHRIDHDRDLGARRYH